MKNFGGGPRRGTMNCFLVGRMRMHCSRLLGVFGGGGGGMLFLRVLRLLDCSFEGASLAFRAWLCGRTSVLGARPFSTALMSLKLDRVPSQSTVHAADFQTLLSCSAARRARTKNSTVWIETGERSVTARLRGQRNSQSSGAIQATIAKKMLSRQFPLLVHGNDGVPAEMAMAATEWVACQSSGSHDSHCKEHTNLEAGNKA